MVGAQLLISSDYENAKKQEAVSVLYNSRNHEPFCNIEELELSSIQVNEPALSVKLVIDEACI